MGRWTKEEIELLEKHYSTSAKEELLELLPNRDYLSIMKKASKLGIQQKKSRWTSGEIEKLKRLYPISNMDTLQKELKGKTESAISSKAKQIKLKKSPEYDNRKRNKGRVNTWSDYEDSILRLHFPYGGYKKVQEELPARSKGAIQARAKKLGIKHDPHLQPMFERKDETIEDIGVNRIVKVTFTKL